MRDLSQTDGGLWLAENDDLRIATAPHRARLHPRMKLKVKTAARNWSNRTIFHAKLQFESLSHINTALSTESQWAKVMTKKNKDPKVAQLQMPEGYKYSPVFRNSQYTKLQYLYSFFFAPSAAWYIGAFLCGASAFFPFPLVLP
jgi:hypothetical protein